MPSIRFRSVVVSLSILFTGLAALPAQARRSFDTIGFKPADDFGRYLVIQGAEMLGKKHFSLGLTAEFNNDSLVLDNAAGVRIRDVIEHQLAMDIAGAVGVTDWLNLGLLVTVVPYQQFLSGPTTHDNGFRMGDIRVDAKARILDMQKYPVGLAIVPFVTAPTGNSTHFIGNGQVTGGAVIALESKRLWNRASIALNLGSQFRHEVTLSPGTTIDSQFLYGAGLNVAVAKPVEVVAELTGWTPWAHFFDKNTRNLEVDGGVRLLPAKGVALTLGGGTGIFDGAGAPDYRAFLMVSYRKPLEEPAPVPPPAPTPAPEPAKEEVITTNRIHFAFNKAAIRPESFPVINEILDSIKGRDEIESVRVEGHTDNVGSDAYNQKLSEQRANAVKTYMVDHGYPDAKVTAVGMGKGSPIADNATKAGRATNRRVEFHLTIKPGAHVSVKKKGEESPTFEEGDKAREVHPTKKKK